MRPTVLLIDDQWGRIDDPMIPERYGSLAINWLLETAAEESGQHSVSAAMRRVQREARGLAAILLDINFGKSESRLGVDILLSIRALLPTIPVLIFTSVGSDDNRELVIQCLELGANEYVQKTPTAQRMNEILAVYADPGSEMALYGNSNIMRLLRAKIARVAFSGEASILVVGESGTGKELVARALHRQSQRRQGAFVPKNCAHADMHLLDSELFGHEKGAFTGAVSERKGLIEESDGGVLFLDEIADMPTELQAKLLRALETHTFRRVGGTKDIESRFQLVCATNRNPEDLLRSGSLRKDFYYRIATVTLQVPPLRARLEDVPDLAEYFLKRFKNHGGGSYPGIRFHADFLSRLQQYAWPGNVRELRNVIEHSIIVSRRALIGLSDLPEPFAVTTPSPSVASAGQPSLLADDPIRWPVARVEAELRLALEVRQRVQAYKGSQWKAEFMRLMYPECKAANAKGFDDFLKRLTHGPWGYPQWAEVQQLSQLIHELRSKSTK